MSEYVHVVVDGLIWPRSDESRFWAIERRIQGLCGGGFRLEKLINTVVEDASRLHSISTF